MTQDEIIRMAREAGLVPDEDNGYLEWWYFAKLVAAYEREACAKVCDEQLKHDWNIQHKPALVNCAAAIRARGEK